MRKRIFPFILIFGLLPHFSLGQHLSGFEENKGQFDQDVFFRTRLAESAVYIHTSGISYQCLPSEQFEEYHQFKHGQRADLPRLKVHTVELDFVNGNFGSPEKIHPSKSYKMSSGRA